MITYQTNDPKGWNGDAARGAAMGRVNKLPALEGVKVTLERKPLDSDGYDENGTYFGTGEPLYWAATEDGELDYTFRAADLEAAKAEVLERIPGAEIETQGAADDFARAYIEALFWTENAPGVTTEEWQAEGFEPIEGTIPSDVGEQDLAESALAEILSDCAKFQAEAADLLAEAYAREGYGGPSQAGHDFWLTRNGHGAGFWDRPDLEDEGLGDKLSAIARRFGGVDVYLGDDSKVYV